MRSDRPIVRDRRGDVVVGDGLVEIGDGRGSGGEGDEQVSDYREHPRFHDDVGEYIQLI